MKNTAPVKTAFPSLTDAEAIAWIEAQVLRIPMDVLARVKYPQLALQSSRPGFNETPALQLSGFPDGGQHWQAVRGCTVEDVAKQMRCFLPDPAVRARAMALRAEADKLEGRL